MIVVSGVIRVAASSAATARQAVLEVAQATRSEDGCISYAFYADLEQEGAFRVFEEWEDDAALAAHFKTPHMAAFREKLSGLEFISREVHRYVVSESSQL
ncbi:MAG: putative quinol monooxygenase [Minwuia sp.]|nr:putative quinol monooxygenase [Minwuia sp.]